MSLVLLYGATGYSGRLIAEEAQRLRTGPGLSNVELVLAGRDLAALDELSAATGFGRMAFSLDHRPNVLSALQSVSVVLNAAGPFAATAPRLGRSAIEANCHYVDISGEVDVYRSLDDLGPIARQRGRALVCGAGRIATASDVLLTDALVTLKTRHRKIFDELQCIRIAHSRAPFVSRGSVRTGLRAIREEVPVVRNGRIHHLPVGQIEGVFDFDFDGVDPKRRRCLASAASLIDTLTAQWTARNLGVPEDPGIDITSYMEMGDAQRLGYELAASGASVLNLPGMQALASRQIGLLREGPRPEERRVNKQVVVLELENRYREVVLRWALETPDPYEFSARTALFAALRLAGDSKVVGWVTPAQVIESVDASSPWNPFSGCRLLDKTETAR